MRCDPDSGCPWGGEDKVSIPVGFSDALRLPHSALALDATPKFQSLLGFLMRCDWFRDVDGKLHFVSIPVGFSDALRRKLEIIGKVLCLMFQSLLGFLMRCDLSCLLSMRLTDTVSIPVGFSDALRPD